MSRIVIIIVTCVVILLAYYAIKESGSLSQKLEQVKHELQQEKIQNEKIDQVHIELKEQEKKRINESKEYHEKLSNATDNMLDDAIPDDMLHGLRSVRRSEGSDTDSTKDTR